MKNHKNQIKKRTKQGSMCVRKDREARDLVIRLVE